MPLEIRFLSTSGEESIVDLTIAKYAIEIYVAIEKNRKLERLAWGPQTFNIKKTNAFLLKEFAALGDC